MPTTHAAVAAALAGCTAALAAARSFPIGARFCNLTDEDRVKLGNGYCDADRKSYNTRACGWDDGDCCQQTCESTDRRTCGYVQNNTVYVGFPQCQDPGVCRAAPTRLGDGLCDQAFNRLVCSWDGGDCCAETCESSGDYACGTNASGIDVGFPNCQDHNVCYVKDPTILGDGFCDSIYTTHANVPACGWDGGDCCAETCVSTANHTCGYRGDTLVGFQNCYDPDACRVVGFEKTAGDGLCNPLSNTRACDWDGGDWCVRGVAWRGVRWRGVRWRAVAWVRACVAFRRPRVCVYALAWLLSAAFIIIALGIMIINHISH